MPFCEGCAQPITLKEAVRLSEGNLHNHHIGDDFDHQYIGLLFCDEDCREDYREYHDPAAEQCDAARQTPLEQMHNETDGTDYGEWADE